MSAPADGAKHMSLIATYEAQVARVAASETAFAAAKAEEAARVAAEL